jgi:hypothetical protein
MHDERLLFTPIDPGQAQTMNPPLTPITVPAVYPLDHFRSFPAEIGSTAPLDALPPPRRVVFPRPITLTAPGLERPPTLDPGWLLGPCTEAPPDSRPTR